MPTIIKEAFPLLILNGVMTEEFRSAVIKRALERLSQAPSESRKRLESAIRRKIKLAGFPDPVKAIHSGKKSALLKAVNEAFQHSTPVAGAVLQVWVDLDPELRGLVTAYLQGTEPDAELMNEIGEVFPTAWCGYDMQMAAEAVVAEHGELTYDDAALMLCCVTGRAPLSDELCEKMAAAPQGPEEEHPSDSPATPAAGDPEIEQLPHDDSLLHRYLTELANLDTTAQEWNFIPWFIGVLQELAQKKQQERESGRLELQAALSRLTTEAANALAWWGFEVAGWTGETCGLQEAAGLAAQVESWRVDLLRHWELEHAVPASNWQEKQQRRTELMDLEGRVGAAYAELALRLSAPLPPTEPPRDRDQEAREADEVAPAGDALREDETRPAGDAAASLLVQVVTADPSATDDATAMTAKDGVDVAPAEPPEPALEAVAPVEIPDTANPDEMHPVVEPAAPSLDLPQVAEEEHAVTETGGEEEPLLAPELVAGSESAALDESAPAHEQTEPQVVTAPQPRCASSKEAALRLSEDDSDANWASLLWAFVAEDDIPAAYWLARSMSSAGREPAEPDWLLAALGGSRRVTPDSADLIRDLLEIARVHQPGRTGSQGLLGLAAAIRPALIAPFSGMLGWLEAPSDHAEFRDLVSAIRKFAASGIGLHSEDVVGVSGEQHRDEAIAGAAREARRWLEEAPGRRKRIVSVWRALLAPKGGLRELLTPVAEDDRDALPSVWAAVEQWRQRSFVDSQLDELNQHSSDPKVDRLTGAGRQDLHREIERAVELAEHWCRLAERSRNIDAQSHWYRDQVLLLLTSVHEALPAVEKVLDELTDPSQPGDTFAAAHCLLRSIDDLKLLLVLGEEAETVSAKGRKWDLLSGNNGLDAALASRLLAFPDLDVDDSGYPIPAGLPSIAVAIRDASLQEQEMPEIAHRWLEKQDYRFIEQLTLMLGNDPVAAEARQRYEDALLGSRAALRAAMAETTDDIEQALLDGIITEEQRSEGLAAFASLTVDEVRNFRAKLDELARIRQQVEQRRAERLAHLRERQDELLARLAETLVPQARQTDAKEFLAAALGRSDTRVVEECLSSIQDALDKGSDLPEGWSMVAAPRDCLEEFASAAQRIDIWAEQTHGDLRGLSASIKEGQTVVGLPFGQLTEPRRKEAAEAMLAWRTLKQQSAKGNVKGSIATILRYLGFNLATGDAESVQLAAAGADWVHAQAALSAGELVRPIPEFGSQAEGRFDVICLWERPGADTIAARLRDLRLDVHTVIVLYLGRITVRQRRDVVRISRDHELAIALLDETLLIFVAQEQNARLPSFLRCALPFSALNPYRPFQAGDVPPEMFFGRGSMTKELMRSAGSCIVYGGRQLGKSALLRQVQREFHHPERGEYAWIENMKLLYDPEAGKGTQALWQELREGFKREGLLSNRITTKEPDEIARHIRRAMQENPNQRVLVMLDEADGFLDADARDNFRVVTALREVMVNTNRRFKVVFAGLQNVQRFQGIPDQPLAHFGAPLCIGPLEPEAAQQLIRDPFEVLGFRFADNAGVLRILSYTNRHPGLIQYFCQELLKRLRERMISALPPYRIEREDVEAVYRSEEVRERIRERFNWTLALDPRYQAIAWTLIEDQMKIRDSYSRPYSPGDTLRLVKDWWPAGFDKASTDQLRGWLDEMCGLGVLVRNQNGHYRLRSPNLVRLLGKESDIADRLLELSATPPPAASQGDSYHAPLDRSGQRYSPLTYAEERRLTTHPFGVGLVFTSQALGQSVVEKAVQRFAPPGSGDEAPVWLEVPPTIESGRQLQDWLTTQARTRGRSGGLLTAYFRLTGKTHLRPGELVRCACDFTQRQMEKNSNAWVLFLFDAGTTWNWLGLVEREKLEDQASAAVWPKPWTLSAIRRRLAVEDRLYSDEVCEEVWRTTGGWHVLLDELLARCGRETDPRPFCKTQDAELLRATGSSRASVSAMFGTDVDPAVERLLRFVLQERCVPLDFLQPEWVGGEPALSLADCMRAQEYLLRLGLFTIDRESVAVDPVVARLLSAA